MRNCIVRQNRARSILISTAGNVLIENNKFLKCTYAGIMTAGDADHWFESGPVRNVIIRNNLFEDMGLGGGNGPILSITPHVDYSVDTSWYYHQNIIFENNTINTFGKILVKAQSVKNFSFKNNTINKSQNYPVCTDENGPAFIFEGCKNIQIERNNYNWGGMATFKVDSLSRRIISIKNKNIQNINL